MPSGSVFLLFYVFADESSVLGSDYTADTCALRVVGARSVFKDAATIPGWR